MCSTEPSNKVLWTLPLILLPPAVRMKELHLTWRAGRKMVVVNAQDLVSICLTRARGSRSMPRTNVEWRNELRLDVTVPCSHGHLTLTQDLSLLQTSCAVTRSGRYSIYICWSYCTCMEVCFLRRNISGFLLI